MLSSNDFSAYVCANALNCQADGVPVLTRRDQLKKKELAAEERKQSKEARKANAKAKAKSKGKACDKGEEDNEDPPKEDPPARSRKRRSSVEKPDGDAAVKAEPEKRVPRAKAKSEAKPVSEAPEPSGSEPVPKPKARGRPKAKAAAEATAAAEKEPEEGDKVQNEIAEKSMEAKQAPKRAPKRASKKKAKAAKLEEEEEVNTPKKKLFESDDEAQDSEHMRIDPKSGEPKPLSQIYETDKPEEWKRTRPKKVDPSAASTTALPHDDKPAKKPKKKPAKKRENNVELSPSAKKEAKRRKKDEENTMREQLVEDSRVQGIFLQHMKAVDGLEVGELKKYLIRVAPRDLKKFVLDPYWGREACGVKSKELASETTLPQVCYIGRFGTAPSSNCGIVLSYISAYLLVSWLESL